MRFFTTKKGCRMKKTTLLTLLTTTNLLFCMQSQIVVTPKGTEEGPNFMRRGDFFALSVMNISDEDSDEESNKTTPVELYDHYFCDSAKTAMYDDILKYTLVKQSLFVQLCVQAAKPNNNHPELLHELLGKIKQGKIETTEPRITITKKDLCYRLLTGIPTGHTHSLINDKTVRLDLRQYETENDKIENKRIKEEQALLPPVQWEWGKGYTPIKLNYSGITLLADYYFEIDEEHHAQIVKEFETLIQK